MNTFQILVLLVVLLLTGAVPAVVVHAQTGSVGSLGPGLQGAVHYEVGDFWKYDLVSAPDRNPQSASRTEIYVRELGAVVFELDGQQVIRQAWRQEWFTNTSTGVDAEYFGVSALSTNVTSQRWFLHVEDADFPLAEAASQNTVRSNYEHQQETRTDVEYHPPLVNYVFPFAEGDQWVIISRRWNTDYDEVFCPGGQEPPCRSFTDLDFRFEVLRMEQVRIDYKDSKFDGRTFDSWLIKKEYLKRSGERFELLWYVPEFCGFVKRQEYKEGSQGGGAKLQLTEWLVDGRCTATVAEVQPVYRTSDPANFSSTRHHGGIVLPGEDSKRSDDGEDESLWERVSTPAPGLLVSVAVLLLALMRGRRYGFGVSKGYETQLSDALLPDTSGCLWHLGRR